MKSPQVQSAAYISSDEKRRYSDLLVRESRAGFYVGTTYNGDHGPEPGSRDSSYFPTREDAEAALRLIVSGKLKTRLEP